MILNLEFWQIDWKKNWLRITTFYFSWIFCRVVSLGSREVSRKKVSRHIFHLLSFFSLRFSFHRFTQFHLFEEKVDVDLDFCVGWYIFNFCLNRKKHSCLWMPTLHIGVFKFQRQDSIEADDLITIIYQRYLAGERHTTEVAFALPTQPSRVWILPLEKINPSFSENLAF